MNAFNTDWAPVGNMVWFTKDKLFGESIDGLDVDASQIKNWNDLIIGTVLEVGPQCVNMKPGDTIGVQVSQAVSMKDLAEHEEIIPNAVNVFIIPETLIEVKLKLNKGDDHVE